MRLMATSKEDLKIIAALVQDSIARIGDMHHESARRRFTVRLNRFRWEEVDKGRRPTRIMCGLMIEDVSAVRTRHIAQDKPDAFVDLLSVDFLADADAPPGGVMQLVFAGGGTLALDVGCIDITLADIGAAWPARRTPDHEGED